MKRFLDSYWWLLPFGVLAVVVWIKRKCVSEWTHIDSWQDASSAATVVGLTAVVVAAMQWRDAQRAQADQSRHQQAVLREQTRPYVIVALDFSTLGYVQISIENCGQTAARDVHIEFDPPLQSTWDDDPETPFTKARTVANLPFWKGITLLAPQQELLVLFDRSERMERAGTDKELPLKFTATVRYTDGSDAEPYQDTFGLDFAICTNPELIETSLKHIDKTLTGIGKTLSNLGTRNAEFWTVTEDRTKRSERIESEFRGRNADDDSESGDS